MKQQSLTLGQRMAISTVAVTVIVLLMAVLDLHTLSDLRKNFENTTTSTARKVELAGVLSTAESDMAVGQRGVILFTYAKDPAQAAAADQLFQASVARFQAAMGEIKPLLATERGGQIASEMENTFRDWPPAYAELKQLADTGNPDGASKLLADRILPKYSALSGLAADLSKICSASLVQGRESAEASFASGRLLMILLALAGAAACAAALWIMRGGSRELQQIATEMLEGSRQVASASGQLASASQSLAQGTSEQAATLEETASSATEITAITRKNAENTRGVAGLMTETASRVNDANHNLEEMISSMKEINSSSEKISRIIRVIDEIAFQTNILALNAAVEAARAGEAGMGFAVVADEVRNLAHRSAQAAKDTAVLIEESIAKSNEGSRKLDLVANSIQQITASAGQVKTLSDEVDVGSQEQSRGIEQISTAVSQMEKVTQKNAANAEESAAASEELAGQARSLYECVERMRRLTGDGWRRVAGSESVSNPHPSAAPARAKESAPAAGHAAKSGVAREIDSFPLDDQESWMNEGV
jgi:methyl-accepting chemotaxis protein/methyl-accepting chemotaxis protein-1 (serine sensor receptor)